MSTHTRSQRFAQAAFPRVQARHAGPRKLGDKLFKEYASFAKKFPALIHTCGLAQAFAFAQAKGAQKKDPKAEKKDPKAEMLYLEDFAAVLQQFGEAGVADVATLASRSREAGISAYIRLSRDALVAASWLKRYVEAVAPETTEVDQP